MNPIPDKEVMCYEPTAHLVLDHQGRPIIYVTLYYDDSGESLSDEVSDVIKLYLEPLEAKRLGLALIRVGQDGIEEEIRRDRDRKECKRDAEVRANLDQGLDRHRQSSGSG